MIGFSGLGALFVWLASLALGGAAMLWWCLRLWRRRAQLTVPVKVVAALGAVGASWGLLGTAWALVSAFSGLAGADPSQGARSLAEGLSMAMSCTALAVLASLASVVVVLILGRLHARRPPPLP